jgi:hypothetical protein
MTLRDWVAKNGHLNLDLIGIIDDWEKSHHGFLPVDKALEKYGDCVIEYAVYDGEIARYKKDGKAPTAWDVWLDIPGMHIGYGGGDRLTIPGAHHDEKLGVSYVIFKGKRSGKNITVVRNGNGPCEIYVDSSPYIEYVTDCGKNPHYVWHGKKLSGDMEAAIWALRDEVWDHYEGV